MCAVIKKSPSCRWMMMCCWSRPPILRAFQERRHQENCRSSFYTLTLFKSLLMAATADLGKENETSSTRGTDHEHPRDLKRTPERTH